MQNFRQLRVWRMAFSLAINIRRATQRFPKTGYSELKAQMISAAESTLNNIVEGCGASSQKEFARFLDISIKSSMELEGELVLARGYRIISKAEWRARESDTIETRKMLSALRKRVLEDDLSRSAVHPQPTAQDRTPMAREISNSTTAHPTDQPLPPQTPQTTSSPIPDYPSTPPDATAPPPRTAH
jgi:four helix bundle protein